MFIPVERCASHCLRMLVALLALAGPALAQQVPAVSKSELERQVTRACKDDNARWCAPQPDKLSDGRDQAMCLKYYMTDLSLHCRAAVEAATH